MKTSAKIILILFLTGVSIALLWILGVYSPGENYRPSVIGDDIIVRSDGSGDTIVILNSSTGTGVYQNNKFGFSIEYPCDAFCQLNPSSILSYQTGLFQKYNRELPTRNENAKVGLIFFSQGSMDVMLNRVLSGGIEGDPFTPPEYPLKKMKEILNSPIDTPFVFEENNFGEGFVTIFEDKKAISITHPFGGYLMRTTYILLDSKTDTWLRLEEKMIAERIVYANATKEDIATYLIATKEVVNMFTFLDY